MDWQILFSEDTVALDPSGRPRPVKRIWVQTIWGDIFYIDVARGAFTADTVKALIEAEMEEYRKLHER